MMPLRLTPPLSLLFLLIGSGVVSQPCCSVYCTISPICALKGSTVTMGCRYTYPYCYQVQRVFWSREWIIDREPSDLSLDPNYIHRCQYHRNSFYEYTLSLSDVTEHDQGFYYCTFIPMTGGNNPCQVGVELFVSELRVEIIPDRVVEGDEVTLTCKTTCSLSYMSTFTWYKQGSQLSQSSNLLHLPSVSQKDAGSYSCSVHGQYYHSPGVTLDVQYPPKSVSVSINPSGEIVEGSSVILICNSNAYPPVHSYTWYRAGSSVGTGNTFIFIRIKSEDSGDYACRAENKHGEQSSSAVSLIVLYPPKSVSVSISPSGEIVKESSVTLTCSSDANPPVHSYTWYKLNESSPVGSGQSYSFTLSSSSSGWFYCEAKNKLRSQRSTAVPLTLNEGRNVLLYTVVGLTIVCGFLIAIIFVLYMRRKRRGGSANHVTSRQNIPWNPTNDTYTALNLQTRSNEMYHTLATNYLSYATSQSVSPVYDNEPTSRRLQQQERDRD